MSIKCEVEGVGACCDANSFFLSKVKMIQLKSVLKVIDNSGALLVECINIIGTRGRNARTGDEIVCVSCLEFLILRLSKRHGISKHLHQFHPPTQPSLNL